MPRVRRRLAAGIACTLFAISAVVAEGAGAHPFAGWTGKSGPFRWQAETVSCGSVTGEPNRIRAHSRWVTSPQNGYQRARFKRQIQDETAGTWTTVQSKLRTTKNSPLKGAKVILHWTQFFQPVAREEGRTSRDVIVFEWKRDRSGSDRTVFSRRVALPPCIIGS
jgi:hypothetical protein